MAREYFPMLICNDFFFACSWGLFDSFLFLPHEIFALRNLRILRVFSNFTEVKKCRKKGTNTGSVYLRECGGLKKINFYVFYYF